MTRAPKTKTVIHYAVCAALVLLAYRFFLGGGGGQKSSDPFRDQVDEHPKNVHWKSTDGDEGGGGGKPSVSDGERLSKDGFKQGESEKSEGESNGEGVHKMDVGDMPKNLDHEDTDDFMHQKEKKRVQEQFKKSVDGHIDPEDSKKGKGKKEKPFLEDGIDWEVEKEMTNRRTAFFQKIKDMEEKLNDDEFKDMHESDDNFAFVTAGSHSTYPATIQFVYSVQYFYPNSKIAVYDIGLTSDEKQFINSLCNTEVLSMWLQLWPESLYKIRQRVWRPLMLQFALSKYGHFVYVEPGRYVHTQGIKDYLKESRKHGVVFGGSQLKHSSFVVTNPHMYTFLMIDERKLQKVPHFEFTLMVLHNTKRVMNFFMRYLITCTLEDYCIAPPGAKPNCDYNMGNNKKYARCHRYDESAINLIMNKWHEYKPREFLIRDVITKYYDGKDMTKRVKVCNASNKEEI